MVLSKKTLQDATKQISKNWRLSKPLTRITAIKILSGKDKGKIKYYGNNPNWEFNPKYLKFKAKVYNTK